jgi:hypothetical protein
MVCFVLPRAQMGGFSPAALEAPPWLQLAIEQSLNDAQGRPEIRNMRADYRDGYLFVIRDRMSGDTGRHPSRHDLRQNWKKFAEVTQAG